MRFRTGADIDLVVQRISEMIGQSERIRLNGVVYDGRVGRRP